MDATLRSQFDDALALARHHTQELSRLMAPASSPHVYLEDAMEELARVQDVLGVAWMPVPRDAPRFLIVDADPDMRVLIPRIVRKLEPAALVKTLESPEAALLHLRAGDPGEGLVIITEEEFDAGMSGAQMLAQVRLRHPRALGVLFTATTPAAPTTARIIEKEGGMRELRGFLAELANLRQQARRATS